MVCRIVGEKPSSLVEVYVNLCPTDESRKEDKVLMYFPRLARSKGESLIDKRFG